MFSQAQNPFDGNNDNYVPPLLRSKIPSQPQPTWQEEQINPDDPMLRAPNSGAPSAAQQAMLRAEFIRGRYTGSPTDRRSTVCRLIGYRFVDCVVESSCGDKAPSNQNIVAWCLQNYRLIPDRCQSFRNAYHQCRHDEEEGLNYERGFEMRVPETVSDLLEDLAEQEKQKKFFSVLREAANDPANAPDMAAILRQEHIRAIEQPSQSRTIGRSEL